MTGENSNSLAGRVLDNRYELLGILGTGGMGTVYKAKHLVIAKIVAVKLLHPHIVSDRASVLRFNQEVHAMSVVNHPHLISISDAGVTEDGAPYFVMEYLEGESLSEIMDREQRLPVERLLSICIQMTEALGYAHEKGLVHRDLKPSNVMLIGRNDFVKIVDLGIAKLVTPNDADMKKLTMTGEVFGSPLYMSPEQCLGKNIDGRSDIYSLGCLMYELATGAAPIQATGPLEVLMRQVSEMPPAFAQVPTLTYSPELANLEQIILRCVQKDPSERYQSMEMLKEVLEQLLSWSKTEPHRRQPLFGQAQVETAESGARNRDFARTTHQDRAVEPIVTEKAQTIENQLVSRQSTQENTGAQSAPHVVVTPSESWQKHIPLALVVLGIFALIGLVATVAIVTATFQNKNAALIAQVPIAATAPSLAYTRALRIQRSYEKLNSQQRELLMPGSDGVQVGADNPDKHVFVISCREGMRRSEFADNDNIAGYIRVVVKPTDKPVDLLLISYWPVHWIIKRDSPGVQIQKIVATGHYAMTVEAPTGANVVKSWHTTLDDNGNEVKEKHTNPFPYLWPVNFVDIKKYDEWNKIFELCKTQFDAEPYKFWGHRLGTELTLE